jgi:hypothetical protein
MGRGKSKGKSSKAGGKCSKSYPPKGRPPSHDWYDDASTQASTAEWDDECASTQASTAEWHEEGTEASDWPWENESYEGENADPENWQDMRGHAPKRPAHHDSSNSPKNKKLKTQRKQTQNDECSDDEAGSESEPEPEECQKCGKTIDRSFETVICNNQKGLAGTNGEPYHLGCFLVKKIMKHVADYGIRTTMPKEMLVETINFLNDIYGKYDSAPKKPWESCKKKKKH